MKYIVIKWPESLRLYDIENWEEHCHLIMDAEGLNKYGSAAYFVEEDWYHKHFN